MCLTAGRCISYSSNGTENTHCYEELAECEQLALDRVALRKALELLLPAEKKKTYIRLESKRSSQISTIKEVFLLSSTDQDEKIQNKTYLGIRPFEDLYVRPRRELFQNTRFF